jgi:hypothetical protein
LASLASWLKGPHVLNSCPQDRYSCSDRHHNGDATLSLSVALAGSGEVGVIADAAATSTDDPSGTPTWIQVHIRGHIGWPAGIGFRVAALTPPDAVR